MKKTRLLDEGLSAISAIAIVLILSVTLFIVFSAVSSIPHLSEGIITDKRYDPPHDQLMIRTVAAGTYRGDTWHYGAHYEIQVVGTTEDGKPRAEWWEVGEAVYERANIGDKARNTNGAVLIVP